MNLGIKPPCALSLQYEHPERATLLEREDYQPEENAFWNTDGEIVCQPGDCKHGNWSWEPEEHLEKKKKTASLKYS